MEMPVRSAPPTIPTPISPSVPSSPSAPRTISFGAPAPAPARPRDLPPAVALALEPKVERVISLELNDIALQIPADYIKPLESIDGTRRILLKASEIEKGMATGKPAVSLASIFQQVPEIFLRTIAPVDESQVALPFDKVLKQFSSLQVRSDQEKHRAVPQVETPFLQATLEDDSKFGTTTEIGADTEDLPPVRIELATAEAYAAAEPEANGFVRQPAKEGTSASPTRIPLKISPNGTGGPAPEIVPASSGPSVPTTAPVVPSEPTRIPFNMAPTQEPAIPKEEPWLTAENVAASPATPPPAPLPMAPQPGSDVVIKISLKPILQALPPFQLNGDPESVPKEAVIEVPFAVIKPQLSIGRITLTPTAFAAVIPTEYRDLFKPGDQSLDVILPLQDVLKNLPASSLSMRGDQEVQDATAGFVTPFSSKADEDAKRFKGSSPTETPEPTVPPPTTAVTPTVAAAPTPPPPAEPSQPAASTSVPSPSKIPFDLSAPAPTAPDPSPAASEVDRTLDAKAVVVELNKLSGVKACAFIFGDGLSLAGSLPAEYETDGLCAIGPSLMQRIENHMMETKLGAIESMTLSCTKGTISFFVHKNLCLAAFHANGELSAEVRKELTQAVHGLSAKYSHSV